MIKKIPKFPVKSGNSSKIRNAIGIKKSGVKAVKGMVSDRDDKESALKNKLNAIKLIKKLVRVDQRKLCKLIDGIPLIIRKAKIRGNEKVNVAQVIIADGKVFVSTFP
jgi:tagatose-1,6-bisphosphate aldolase